MEDEEPMAVAYRVWQVDCGACGHVQSYGEDGHPDNCEECDEPVREA